jgi:hypothetical protein
MAATGHPSLLDSQLHPVDPRLTGNSPDARKTADMRHHQLLTAATGTLALVGSFLAPAPARAQEQIVEKIPLQYVDARYVAYLLGGRILPTEADLWMGRRGGFGAGAGGPQGGGSAPGSSILADPATNSILMLPGGQAVGLLGGRGVYGDPQTNSLLVGPQYSSRGNGAPARNRLYGVPGSNSLLYRYPQR